jgi:hypothetical protein
MDQKEVKVDCPCCRSRLEIDVRTAAVLRWRPRSELDETGKPVVRESDWSEAAGRVSRRTGAAGDKFDESLTKEKKRAQDLDELFKKANEKLGRKEDG